jgi:hypothetical protein
VNRIHYAFLAGCSALGLAGCGADDVVAPNGNIIVNPAPTPTPTPTQAPGTVTAAPAGTCAPGTTDGGTISLQNNKGTLRNCIVPQAINANLTLSGRRADGYVYTLAGRTEVGKDIDQTGGVAATLTVLPGVTVAGIKDSNLVVNRGSKLEADGTSAQPIIFTSVSNLTTTLGNYATNEWGGIIINGRAPVSDCDAAVSSSTVGGSAGCWRQSEGIVPRPLFGGNVANDDSGTLRYVQVNFTGVTVGIADEIQGITWNGVGSGTLVDYVQIHNSSDDGMEFFGGTVNAKHLVLTGNADDSLDTDNGYRGAMQFVLAARHDASGYPGDSAGSMTMWEVDSSAVNDASPRQFAKLANFTFIQNTPDEPGIKIRGGADVALINGIVVSRAGGTKGCLDIDDNETVQAAGTYSGTADVGPPILRSVVFDCAVVNDSDGDTHEATTISNAANANVNTSFVSSLLFLSGATTGNKPANGTNESAVVAEASIKTGTNYGSSFFDQVAYIGAFSSPSDTWTSGWTCNSVIVDLRGATSCTDVRVS